MAKVLLDPIYSHVPSSCSSALKARHIADHTLNVMGRTDIYFRQFVPASLLKVDDQNLRQMAWFLDHPNIQYIPIDQSRTGCVRISSSIGHGMTPWRSMGCCGIRIW